MTDDDIADVLAPCSPELPDRCRKCLRPHTRKSSRDGDANNQLADRAPDELDPHPSFDRLGPSAPNVHDPMLELLLRFSQYSKSRLTIGASIIAAQRRRHKRYWYRTQGDRVKEFVTRG
jgi:hypothetical protein